MHHALVAQGVQCIGLRDTGEFDALAHERWRVGGGVGAAGGGIHRSLAIWRVFVSFDNFACFSD